VSGTMRSGRKPKPTALKALQGGKMRPHNRREPKYRTGAPPCPPMVESRPLVKAKWDELVARFSASRVLTEAHGEALAVLATTWVDFERDYNTWASVGYPPILIDERKRARAHPLASRVEKLREQLMRRLGEFGATPVMGPKVQAGDVLGDDDPAESFLRAVK